MKRIGILLGSVLLALGATGLYRAYLFWQAQSDFDAHAVHARGVVTDMGVTMGGAYNPIIQFSAADGSIMHVSGQNLGSNRTFAAGETVSIVFDPANPGHAQVDDFWQVWRLQLALGIGGAVLAVLGGFTLRAQTRVHRSAGLRRK